MLCLTLCSNNYLALAKTLARSWVDHHPEGTCVIGLVDRPDATLDYTLPARVELLPVEEIGVPDLPQLADQYDVAELCTAVKPYFLEHLLQRADGATVFYLDPDIFVYRRLSEAIDALATNDVVVTPHICSPIPGEELGPTDLHVLRGGVFNLGFIGLRRGQPAAAFLKWWQAKTARYAFRNEKEGLFYDQIWANFIPAFFAHAHVERHPGYNVANWNLHERTITRRHDAYWVNDAQPLTFFHFSSYRPDEPDVLARYNQRYSFANRPDVQPLFADYSSAVLAAGYRAGAGLTGYFQRAKAPPPNAVRVVLRFPAPLSAFVRSRSWHETQQIADLPSGEIELSARIADLAAFQRFVLAWGEHATVVSPPELAAAIAQRLSAAAANYRSSG